MAAVETIEALERIYGDLGAVGEASTTKVADHITPHYRRLIEVAPFVALATVGPEGLDCSPRGDLPGFVRVADPRTLILPDRRGNNRIDSLRNVVRDPRVGLMFLIPGIGNALRVNGRRRVEADPALLDTFAVDGKAPRTALVITVGEVYFQCARALIRSGLWRRTATSTRRPCRRPAGSWPGSATAGSAASAYDAAWAERAPADDVVNRRAGVRRAPRM